MKRDWLPKVPAEHLLMACGLGPIHDHLLEDFRNRGDELLARCKEHGWLRPEDRVLDVDCRAGRFAQVLLDEPVRSYVGLHWDKSVVDWGNRELTLRDPRFRFQFFDFQNYNAGQNGADGPYFEDGSFDFVLLDSIFTAVGFDIAGVYLRELRRLIAPGGRIVANVLFSVGRPYTLPGLSFFNQKELTELAGSHGFEIELPDGPYTDRIENWMALKAKAA